MNENMLAFENTPTLEKRIVSGLRLKGRKDPEVLNLLIEWSILQEKEVDRISLSDKDGIRAVKAEIRSDIKRSRIYFEGNYLDEGFESLNMARHQALEKEINDTALYDEITREINERDKQFPESE